MTELTVVLNHTDFALNHQDKKTVANSSYQKDEHSCSKVGYVVNGS